MSIKSVKSCISSSLYFKFAVEEDVAAEIQADPNVLDNAAIFKADAEVERDVTVTGRIAFPDCQQEVKFIVSYSICSVTLLDVYLLQDVLIDSQGI